MRELDLRLQEINFAIGVSGFIARSLRVLDTLPVIRALQLLRNQRFPGNPMGLREMAGATGLDPAASCVTGRRSNHMNYAPA